MSEKTVEYEVIVYGERIKVATIKDAENRLKRHDHSDFAPSYIVRKEYDDKGILVGEIMVG
jgi:hypothetical protein